MGGIRRAGWRLAYGEKPSEMFLVFEAVMKAVDLVASIGIVASGDGYIQDVIPGKAADRAGLAPGL